MPVFDTESHNLIKTWGQSLAKKISIKLVTTGSREDKQFASIAEQLTNKAPDLAIAMDHKKNMLPGFVIAENIRFHAFPLEKELSPFLGALSLLTGKNKNISKPLLKELKKINIPVRLKLYIALQCPHCPNMVNALVPMALENHNITLEIIDGSLFSDMAQKDNVMAAPCLILDNDFRWTGNASQEEIIQMCLNKDPSQLSTATLQTILEQGDASWIARQMIQKEKIFDGFCALCLHDTWSIRLGAMVVVEELAEKAPSLANQLCPILMAAFDNKETTVQGDILYLLGEAGAPHIKNWINVQLPLLKHPDLADAAQQALETLKERHGD